MFEKQNCKKTNDNDSLANNNNLHLKNFGLDVDNMHIKNFDYGSDPVYNTKEKQINKSCKDYSETNNKHKRKKFDGKTNTVFTDNVSQNTIDNNVDIVANDEKEEYDSDNIECKNNVELFYNSHEKEDFEFLALYNKYDELLYMANNFYAKNEIRECKAVLKKMFVMYPTKPESFYILSLIYEDEDNTEQSYNCLLNYALIKKSQEMYYKMYLMSIKLDKKLDTIFFIKRLLKATKNRDLAQERVNLYEKLHAEYSDSKKTNKTYYYKMLYSKFEMIEYDGFVHHIKNYIQDCNLVHIKKLLTIVYKQLMTKRSDEKYYNDFLDLCFYYKEYTYYKNLTVKYIKNMTQTRKIQYLIANEEINLQEETKIKYNNINNIKNIDQCVNFDIFGEDILLDKLLYKEYEFEAFINEEFIEFDVTIFLYMEVLAVNSKYDMLEKLLIKYYEKVFDRYVVMQNIAYKDIESIVFDNIATNHNKYNFLFYVGIYCKSKNRLELAYSIFRKLNNYKENDEAVTSHLQEIYKAMQNDNVSKMYSTIEDTIKKRKITQEEVIKTRQKYNNIMSLLYEEQNKYNSIDTNEISITNIDYKNADTKNNNKKRYSTFLAQAQELLRDFFSNTIFFNKDITYDQKEFSQAEKSKQAKRKMNVLYKKLHGLEFEEWYELVKTSIFCYIEQNEYKKAIELVHQFLVGKTCDKDSKKYVKYFEQISFIGLRFAVYNNDLVSFIRICKKLYKEPLFVIYFFSNFFPDYVNCLLFKQTQRNLHRLLIRNSFDKAQECIASDFDSNIENINNDEKEDYDMNREKIVYKNNKENNINVEFDRMYNENSTDNEHNTHNNDKNNINVECDRMYNENSTDNEQNTHKNDKNNTQNKYNKKLKEDYGKLSDDARAEFLLTLMPRYLHKKSIKLLNFLVDIKNVTYKEAILVSVMYLNHSTSIKEANVEYYLVKGLDILFKSAETHENDLNKQQQNIDDFLNTEKYHNKKEELNITKERLYVCWYNIGRAYTMFGLHGMAEHYYKKSIEAKGSIKIASYYNLCKIYQNNGNLALYKELTKKYEK